jgi:hypothetical protein
MRKLRYGLIAASALAIVALASPLHAQPYGPGYGMMGGYGAGGMMGPGYGRMMGPGYGGMMGGYGPGYGMMGGYGPGMMRGYGGYGPGMMGGYGGGYGMGPGMMQGYGYGMGPGMMGYGPGYYGNQGNLNLTTDQVKQYLERMIRNPNLKVGDVKEKDADTIVAEVVTKQGNSLVQRLDFNRHNGFVQPEQ